MYRHDIADFFELLVAERNAVPALLDAQRIIILGEDIDVSGFNVGENAGATVGQTVSHCAFNRMPMLLFESERDTRLRGSFDDLLAFQEREFQNGLIETDS